MAAHVGFYPRDELAHREGLGYIIVGSVVEPHYLIPFLLAGGDHDDGDRALFADAAKHLEAVHAGKHDVQKHEIDLVRKGEGKPFDPVLGDEHVEAVAL